MGRKWRSSLRKKFKELGRDVENLINAIKGDKFWYAIEGNKSLIYVVALTRARTFSEGNYWARCTGIGRVKVKKEIRKLVRRYRILLVDLNKREATKVLTWKAFKKAISANLHPDYMPNYLNVKRVRKIIREVETLGKR